jgi:hypothetical protein
MSSLLDRLKEPAGAMRAATVQIESLRPTEMNGAVVLRHPAAASAPGAQYLDPSADLETLDIPFARFPGVQMVLPDRETVCQGWSAFVEELAPQPAPVIEQKYHVPYYISGTLKEAELKNEKLRKARLARGKSTIGKQRSADHIEALGPALLLDHDGDVFSCEPALRVLGVAALIYSSFSYGFPKGDATEPARGGRVAVVLNRPVTSAEYGVLWDAVNHLLGGSFDEHGRSPALCYGRHARRSADAPYKRVIIPGAALDADALIELGRSLRPERSAATPAQNRTGRPPHSLTKEIERTRLMGAVLSPDLYGDWMSGAAAFKRAFPDNIEAAFVCFDAWSASSAKYAGTEAARRKFDQVPAQYTGPAVPVTLSMLHWRARRRAEEVIGKIYQRIVASVLAITRPTPCGEVTNAGNQPGASISPRATDDASRGDAIAALDYLSFCWGKKVFEEITAAYAVPPADLDEAQRRGKERRETIDLAGRTLHRWGGKDLAADTAALGTAIVSSGAKLYRVDKTLVRISEPMSDEATATRVRKIHGYTGRPGDAGDPALHAGERLIAMLPADLEALREIIAAGVATKRRVNDGTKAKPDWREEIVSFGFKPSAKLHDEPDAGVLKDLGKRVLIGQVPEIVGVITAPVMPNLPSSTNSDDLLQSDADRIIISPGFDAPSGLYLSPVGTIASVADKPSEAEVKAAADLLRTLWSDFPFVSPGDGLAPEVSRSVAIYGMMLSVNRRALPLAPGIAFGSHGAGMSTGKTLSGEVIGTIATGQTPAPVSLSTDFTEQRKEIITYMLEGDGCLFLDNITTGTRFDSAPLAAVMTSTRFKGRFLGTNKQIEVSTAMMIIATGNSLNMAGDLASRFLLSRLDTALERPEDRSAAGFKIPDLRRWVVEHRQQLVAAVHTIVRAYLQECRHQSGSPQEVVSRRAMTGSRFGGPCEVLRDAMLWAFPDLPDPFLSFRASAAASSTKGEAELVLALLDRLMVSITGKKHAPSWSVSSAIPTSPERARWEPKFQRRWARMSPDERRLRYGTNIFVEAQGEQWRRLGERVRAAIGRREVRAGRSRLTASDIVAAISSDESAKQTLEGATHARSGINPVSLGRWLKDRLVDAPTGGLVLRSAPCRQNCACFWIEKT